MNRWLRRLFLLLVFGAIWAASGALLRSDAPGRTARAAAERDRRLFFRLERGERVRFRLEGVSGSVRIASHVAVTPSGDEPDSRHEYSLRVRVRGPSGEELLSREVFLRSRESGAAGRAWRVDGASRGLVLTDRRDFELQLPHALARGHVEVEAAAAAVALVRAFAVSRREGGASLPGELIEQRAARLTYAPLELLREEERRGLAARNASALVPEGDRGRDFTPVFVEAVSAAASRLEAERERGETIDARSALALTVRSAGTVTLDVARVGAAGDEPIAIRVESIGEGEAGPWTFAVGAGAPRSSSRIAVPGGVRTLVVRTGSDEAVRVTARFAPAGRAGGEHELVPDRRRLTLPVAGSAGPPVRFELAEAFDLASRVVRLEVRAIGQGASPVVTMSLQDANGRELSRIDETVDAPRSDFERAGGATDAPDPGAATTLSVSDPIRFQLVLPRGVRRLALSSTGDVAISAARAAQLPAPPADFAAPYDVLRRPGFTWRHAPLARRGWHPLRASNEAELAAAGRQVGLLAQVRLEPAGGRGSPVASHAVKPSGSPERQLVLEPVPRARSAAAIARWGPRSYARLEPGAPLTLRFEAAHASRPHLRFWVDATSSLGGDAPVDVAVDGGVLRARPRAIGGRWLLPALPPGSHELAIRTTAGARFFVNRPPDRAGGAELFQLRDAFALGAEPLVVRVRREGGREAKVLAIAYTHEGAAPVRLRVAIDGGRPSRVTGVPVQAVTAAERLVVLDGPPRAREVVLLNRASPPLVARSFALTLGRDLPSGEHEVRVERASEGDVWLRFLATSPEARAPTLEEWESQGWPDEPDEGDLP